MNFRCGNSQCEKFAEEGTKDGQSLGSKIVHEVLESGERDDSIVGLDELQKFVGVEINGLTKN